MNFLQQRIMASKITKAREAVKNANCKLTPYPAVYVEQAINILNSCIDQLNNQQTKEIK